MNTSHPYPQVLEPELVASRCQCTGTTPLLNSLADRGIILNTWQAAELSNEGSRGFGKTMLSYIKLAEQECINLNHDNFDRVPDPDIDNDSSSCRKIEYMRGLKHFTATYYPGKFATVSFDRSCFTATSHSLRGGLRRWWN